VASSFVCASATVRYLRQVASVEITLLPTGIGPGRDGDEDAACADYVTALLESTGSVDSAPYVRRVHESRAGRLAAGQGATAFHASDLACCVAVDRFGFAMPVSREAGLLIMRPVVV
jgi:2-phosphosulfolactate phosphatase